MKTKGRVLLCGWALVACLLDTPPVLAQAAPDPAALHTQQLAAEREALQAMLDDANTPAEKRALIRLLLDWNARGGTISEFKQRQIMPAAPVPNLARRCPECNKWIIRDAK